MTLRSKFVIPINLILVGILVCSLAWEWWRLDRNPVGKEMLDATLSEDPGRVVERILERLVRFRGDRPQEDDPTLMVAELPPAAAKPGVDAS